MHTARWISPMFHYNLSVISSDYSLRVLIRYNCQYYYIKLFHVKQFDLNKILKQDENVKRSL
jgi:hypothetical protein